MLVPFPLLYSTISFKVYSLLYSRSDKSKVSPSSPVCISSEPESILYVFLVTPSPLPIEKSTFKALSRSLSKIILSPSPRAVLSSASIDTVGTGLCFEPYLSTLF